MRRENRKVITYCSPAGHVIRVTREQERLLAAHGVWPRDDRGEEFCQVMHGLHVGRPSYSDAELLAMCGIAA